MPNFEEINENASDSNILDKYLEKNIKEVFDFINEDYAILINQKDDFREFIFAKFQIISGLDFSKSYNSAFILLLFDYAERFKQVSPARLLINIIEHNNFSVGQRLEAAQKFLFAKKYSEYLQESNSIFKKLETAFIEEEDDEKKTLLTLGNFLSLVFDNSGQFHKHIFFDLISKLRVAQKSYYFLKFEFVNELLSYNYSDFEEARNYLQNLIDNLLRHKVEFVYQGDRLLIERNTNYSQALENISTSFEAIQTLSQSLRNSMQNGDAIFHSLQRGVAILKDLRQLVVYFSAFGKMHNTKLISAFEVLSPEFFEKEIEIIDWACGQGLASISYFDFLNVRRNHQVVRKVTLIEPSEVALKRGALHVQKFNRNSNIETINKDLDSLNDNDFQTENGRVRLHLFSNILDVEFFSISKLQNLISRNFQGENYFVCVSPYITDLKTNRIDAFVDSFQNFTNFQLIATKSNRKGEWNTNANWTRVLRVFKAQL